MIGRAEHVQPQLNITGGLVHVRDRTGDRSRLRRNRRLGRDRGRHQGKEDRCGPNL